jgi:AraC family transcriptional regulator
MKSIIENTLYYIEHHLDDELNSHLLAQKAGYSTFHFSRAFKEIMGESLMSYVARLRLERSARHVGLKETSMINVALDAGYKTPTGFLKAFKKQFTLTPTDYKEQSKQILHSDRSLVSINPVLVIKEPLSIVFVREYGGYEQSSKNAWERLYILFEKLENKLPQHLYNMQNSVLIGLCHDDPEITQADKIRYDAGMVFNQKEIAFFQSEGFSTQEIAGGNYIKITHNGTFEESDEVYRTLYAWIDEHNYVFRDEPSLEHYHNTLDMVDESHFITD